MWFAVSNVSWNDLKQHLATANLWLLLPMMGMLIAFYWLKAWRWQLLLQPIQQLSLRQITPPLLIGFMANNLLPAHLGEFVRVFVLGEKYGIKKTAVLSTVVLERVFDIIAILFLLGISLVFVEGLPPKLVFLCQVMGAASLVGVAVLVAYLTFTEPFVKCVQAVLNAIPFLPTVITKKVIGLLDAATEGLTSIRQPAMLWKIGVSSMLQWMLNAGMIFLSAKAVGMPLSYFDSLMVMGAIVFAILLPAPPGYFGVLQAAFTAVLGSRFDESLILATSMFYHMAQYIPVTLVGLAMLPVVGMNFRQLSKVKDDSESSKSDTAEAIQN